MTRWTRALMVLDEFPTDDAPGRYPKLVAVPSVRQSTGSSEVRGSHPCHPYHPGEP